MTRQIKTGNTVGNIIRFFMVTIIFKKIGNVSLGLDIAMLLAFNEMKYRQTAIVSALLPSKTGLHILGGTQTF